jgi:hypothetical protein
MMAMYGFSIRSLAMLVTGTPRDQEVEAKSSSTPKCEAKKQQDDYVRYTTKGLMMF